MGEKERGGRVKERNQMKSTNKSLLIELDGDGCGSCGVLAPTSLSLAVRTHLHWRCLFVIARR